MPGNLGDKEDDRCRSPRSRAFDIGALDLSGAPINGTPGGDNLVGTLDDETIDGKAGNDVISGNLAGDTLIGGDGDDGYSLGAYEPLSIVEGNGAGSGTDTITSTSTRSFLVGGLGEVSPKFRCASGSSGRLIRSFDDGLGERRPRDRVDPHAREPRAAVQQAVPVGDRHQGRLLADPGSLEIPIRSQPLVLVAKRGRADQQLLELFVAIEPRVAPEGPIEHAATRIGVVGAPSPASTISPRPPPSA